MCKDPNEYFTECGPACGGDGCTTVQRSESCDQDCKAGCFCMCGYFRNSKGVCVPGEECDAPITNVDYPKYCVGKQCCADFTYLTESNSCLEQCQIPGGPLYKCATSGYLGCFCLPGYRRDPHTNECIPARACKKLSPIPPPSSVVGCPANQTTAGCGNCESCDVGLRLKTDQPALCLMFCKGEDSCKCDTSNGFFRSASGNCISLEDCKAEKALT